MSNHQNRHAQHQDTHIAGDFNALKNDAQNLLDQGTGIANTVKEKVVDAKDAVVDGALSIFGKATRIIRAYPIATIAVAGVLAVGAGFVVMRMIRR